MKTDRFHLEVVAIKDIITHEEFDPSRSLNLIKKLKESNLFTDPIIVASLGNNKFLQLDGMNRINCFKKLGFKYILCQIIDYNNQEEFELSSWIHIFKAKREDFFKHIKKDKSLIIKKADINQIGPRYIKAQDFGRLVTVVDKKAGTFLVMTAGNFIEKIKRMNYIVSFYQDIINRAILPFPMTSRNIRLFFYEHPDLNFYDHPDANLMVVFPKLTPQQIIEVVRGGALVPAGITRHFIKDRCLNVNISLSFFDNKKSITQLNKDLDKFLLKKILRIYEESTIHFE
ncbi:hypothetical protein HZA76_02270 [Candidatus Roizmanbacteria bacterium]|nr:hypothetical protein [Candidatus Roizmanbacteria bacterium]